MKAQEIMASDDFKRCVDFHGHVCPGLAIGFKASRIGMERLSAMRAEDEELVAIVETDACSADAVQVLTGCTFGKGNFIFRDYGKMVLTLLNRNTGSGIRIALKPDAFGPNEEHLALLQKVMQGQATETEQRRFRELHFKRSCEVLETPNEEFFEVQTVTLAIPAKARIEPSESCSRCGEPTMRSKLRRINGQAVCRGCLAQTMGGLS